MVRFEVRTSGGPLRTEYGVFAVVPSAGNDAALLAVFDSRAAADALSNWLNSLRLTTAY